jgi:hypothetical protein
LDFTLLLEKGNKVDFVAKEREEDNLISKQLKMDDLSTLSCLMTLN